MAVLTETAGHVLTITLDRPGARNALDWDTLERLAAAFATLDSDDELWVAVLTGSGVQSFCAGADLRKLPGEAAAKLAAGEALPATPLTGLVPAKPVVCAINGDAIGGGLELALACDVRVCAEHARLGLTEARWSLVPAGGGTWWLPRLVGRGRALELMLTGARIDATRALGLGLVERVCAGAELRSQADALVAEILRTGPLAARAIKRLVVGGEGRTLAEGLAAEQHELSALQRTRDAGEGLMAFIEKRAPAWEAR